MERIMEPNGGINSLGKMKGVVLLDKNKFLAMSPAERVRKVNKLLHDCDLNEISFLIGIPISSLSKIMKEGDYLYHKVDKKY